MNWKIEFMKCVPQVGAVQNWVVECGWRCTVTQDEHSTGSYGVCSFEVPDAFDGTFTPYNKLTEQQVLGWVWTNGVDKAEVEANVARQLDALINPAQVILPLPWAA